MDKENETIGNEYVLMGKTVKGNQLEITKESDTYVDNLTDEQKQELLKQVAEQINNKMKNAIKGNDVYKNIKRITDVLGDL